MANPAIIFFKQKTNITKDGKQDLHCVKKCFKEGWRLVDDGMSQPLRIAVAYHMDGLFGRLEGGNVPKTKLF